MTETSSDQLKEFLLEYGEFFHVREYTKAESSYALRREIEAERPQILPVVITEVRL